MPIALPEAAAAALAALKAAGIPAWVVGGAVRDSLLNRPVKDWDVTAECTPERLAEALPGARPIGGVCGTVSWRGVEITPCRAERGYSDHRHPDEVTFGATLQEDLSRRDFTVNAMAYDGETITDPFRGQDDLRSRILRCVGEPQQRFEEDALRILRLYRFAGALDFTPEEKTAEAALQRADTLAGVSAPRVRGELEKALQGPRPSALAPLIAAGGLAAFGIPADALRQNPDALLPLDNAPVDLFCRWWALLRLADANYLKATRTFDFGKAFDRAVEKLDALFTAGCPADLHALKLQLRNPLPFDEQAAVLTMAAVSPALEDLPGMLARLYASGEPFRKEQLAITPPQLLALGVRDKKISAVQDCLLRAVIDTPACNTYQMLARMADELKKLV